VITCRAVLDVPRELVSHVARLPRAERKVLGTRRGVRVLTCHHQAIPVLVWFRKGEDQAVLGAGFRGVQSHRLGLPLGQPARQDRSTPTHASAPLRPSPPLPRAPVIGTASTS
jgi:hypothetical protein